jgi:hypothetical protein
MKSERGSIPSKMEVLGCAIILLALTSSTAWAHTPIPTPIPTNTDGPSPTPTASGSPTPTGTRYVPELIADARPNPARAGQRVTLDATRNPSGLNFRWQQVPGDVPLDIVDADQPVAHFIAPAVTEITVVQVQLQSQNDGRLAYAFIQLLPSDVVLTSIGNAYGAPGGTVPIDVTLQPAGLQITTFEHELSFDPYAPVADRGGGVPDCAAASELSATSAQFAFVPAGCAASGTCTGLHASVTTPAPIPDGAVVYRCQFALSEEETPDEISCYHAFICAGGGGETRDGDPIRVACTPDSNGFAWVNYSLRPLQFQFSADPAMPNVGDTVQVTFSVFGQGGLPVYQLGGSWPYFDGETTQNVGGPLGSVTFELQAMCPGTAPLSLSVEYETVGGCPGHTYFQFTRQSSPVFPLTVREPGAYSVSGRVAELPTGCMGAVPNAHVRLDPLGWIVQSDESGAFAFDGVPPGDYTLAVAEGCGNFQCYPAQSVHVGEDDVAMTLCPTRLAGEACIGDCDLDDAVHVDELIVGVAMALGQRPFSACPAIDADGNGSIAVNEVVAAVGSSLGGCPAHP